MKMTEKEFRSHRNYYDGYCIHCDAITRDGSTEPDAENYECFECGEMSCIGMDYALLGEHIEIIQDHDDYNDEDEEDEYESGIYDSEDY